MELVQELFVTASVALLLSFIVAKLVSMAMPGDVGPELGVKSSENVEGGVVVEEMKFGEGLSVRGFETETRVEFVGEDVKKVDHREEERSDQVDENIEISCHGEEVVEECCEVPEKSVQEGVGKESEVVELTENSSSEEKSDEEVVVAEEVGESGLDGVKEGNLGVLVVEEKVVNREADEFGVELETDNTVVTQSEEVRVVRREEDGGGKEKEGLSGDEDDWEGIERSELEKDFAAAAAYVGSEEKDGRLSSVGSDVQMQLYGLQKVAMEGPCHESQPMALKMSARAKWNAWQRLGNMNPEVAMEQYITLLSDRVPGWMDDNSAGDNISDILEAGIPSTPDPDSSTSLQHQPYSTNERIPELNSGTEGVDSTGGSDLDRLDLHTATGGILLGLLDQKQD